MFAPTNTTATTSKPYYLLPGACIFIFLPSTLIIFVKYAAVVKAFGPADGIYWLFLSLNSTSMPNVDTYIKLCLRICCQSQHRKDLFSDPVGPSFSCICKVKGIECLVSLP